jgi:hypothetical protein
MAQSVSGLLNISLVAVSAQIKHCGRRLEMNADNHKPTVIFTALVSRSAAIACTSIGLHEKTDQHHAFIILHVPIISIAYLALWQW